MNTATAPAWYDPSTVAALPGARIVDRDPLRVISSRQPWAYAVSFGLDAPRCSASATPAYVVEVVVSRGRIGIGVTNADGTRFLSEKFVDGGRRRIRLAPRESPGLLVFRNAERADEAEFTILSVAEVEAGPAPYLVELSARNFADEPRPDSGDTVVFDDQAAQAINHARLEWLAAAELPVVEKRVLDVGCGVGHFAPFYLERRCSVVGVDGREENVEVLRRRHPEVTGYVADVQAPFAADLGLFDVVHCFGLLYHLESPVAALRNMFAVCREFIILETMVCDSSRAIAVLADETKTANQALAGLGCRPSPKFVVLALNRIGFSHVYGTIAPPAHPDFLFTWQDNLETSRDDHNLRCVFVGSRHPLECRTLVPLLEP
jgi:SAM-dependent methyltransferase